MAKFYFTYGTENQPFYGGWTEVEAPDMNAATAAFQAFHPNSKNGFINCAGIYPENYFVETKMFEHGNFGCRCHERISLTQEIAGGEQDV